MDGLVFGLTKPSGLPALVARDLTQLGMQLAPFVKSGNAQELFPGQAIGLAAGMILAGLLPPLPQPEQGQKIRTRHDKLLMGLIGRLLLFQRSLADIGNSQGGHQDQDFCQALAIRGFKKNTTVARIDR